MKTKLLIVLAAVAVAIGQEARIMIVEKDDSKTLAAAYKDYKEAQKRWEKVKIEVAKKYTTEEGTSKPIAGWEHVQFSADFRAIVPANSQYATVYYGNGYWPYANSVSIGGSGSITGASSLGSTGTTITGKSIDADMLVHDDVIATLKTTTK